MATNRTTITAKISMDLATKIEQLKDRYFNGNKSALLTKALQDLVTAYEQAQEGEAQSSPRLAEARKQSDYIENVLLVGLECDEILKEEVMRLCQLIG